MNRSIKDLLTIVFIGVSIFLLPSVLDNYFVGKKTDIFFERVDEDFGDCVKNAKEDGRDIRWCKEIRESSKLAFNSAKRVSDTHIGITYTQTFLFVLAGIFLTLKRRVEDLENK